MLPLRCFSCNKVLARYDQAFHRFKDAHKEEKNIPYVTFFEEFKITRYCCRKIFLTHINPFEQHPSCDYTHIERRSDSEIKKIIIAR